MSFPGFCQRRQEIVTDEECLTCYTDEEWKLSPKNIPRTRMVCVEMNIAAPVAIAYPAPQPPSDPENPARFMAMVDSLTRDDMRAVFANLAMLIDQHQDNPVAGAIWAQVQSHAAYRRNDQ